jgi:ribosome recycling factor
MKTAYNLPLTFNQIALLVRQLPEEEQRQLVKILEKAAKKEKIETHFASQDVLAQDWLNAEEEKAWQHL